MKTNIIAQCIIGLCTAKLYSMAQNKPFIINGKLQNISSVPARTCITEALTGTLQKYTDSTRVIDGEYHFKGKLIVDEGVAVMLSSAAETVSLKGLIINLEKGELDVASDGPFKNSQLSGNAAAAYNQAIEINKGILKEKEELKKIAASNEYKTNGQLQANVLKRSQLLSSRAGMICIRSPELIHITE